MNDVDIKLHLDATRARCSALQTRLSATLDALDAAHAARDAEERAARVASAAARQAEEERDELREAVALLVEKVESEGDWRVLHPATLRLAEPADDQVPLDPLAANLADDKAYVQPLLSSLSSQLDSERRRREDAEQQVALLSAQVARREAELEARLDPRNDGRSDGAMTREAALGVLELTIARNRALEADVKVLEAKLKASRVYPAESPPPRPSSSRLTLVGSPQKRKALAPDRVRSAPPISPARSIRELVPPLGPRPTFLSPRRPSRPRSTPSPLSTPRSDRASTPSPVRSPSPRPQGPNARPPPAPPRTPPPPAVVALNAHVHALEDGVAELHREHDRLAALPTHPAPFDPAQFARVGLLEAECVRLRRRVRELEQAQARAVQHGMQMDERIEGKADEDEADVTIRAVPPLAAAVPPHAPPPTAAPAPLLPPIDLRPPLAHRASAPPARSAAPPPLSAPPLGPPRTQAANAQEQRLAQLSAELARAQDGVAERERAMDELRAEIARLRGG